MEEIKVELRPHIAKERKAIGNAIVEVPVEFNQCYVIVGGKQVAWYCGRQNEPGKYLSFVEPMNKTLQDAIAKAVAKLTGGVSSYNAPPPDEHDVIEGDD